MNYKITSKDTINLYHKEYFLEKVDGFLEYKEFSGKFEELFERYKQNIYLLDLNKNHKYLEYGCGRGEICIYHSLNGGKAVGIDYSKDAINLAIKKRDSLKLDTEFFVSSFADYETTDNSFDRILASEFIEHISIEEGELFFKMAYRALKPGGKLLIFTHPNTLQRRYGYLVQRIIFNLFGKHLPKKQPDTTSEHYKNYHLNEQNYFSLNIYGKKSGFTKFIIDYDCHQYKKGQNMKNILRFFIKNTPLKHIFSTNLYLLAEK